MGRWPSRTQQTSENPTWEYVLFHGQSSADSFSTRTQGRTKALANARQSLKERRARWHHAYGESDSGGEWKIVEYRNGDRTGKVYKVR